MADEQADDLNAEVELYKKKLIGAASLLFASQDIYGKETRTKTMTAYGRLLDAHMLTTGALGSALIRTNRKIVPVTPTSLERTALFASLIIGLPACESAIVEGRYLQAGALLRQEVETLAQLVAVRLGRRQAKKSPNVNLLEKSTARLYGDLSAAAHVSRHDLVRDLTQWTGPHDGPPDSTAVTRFFPGFDETTARRMFALHLYLLIQLANEMNDDLLEKHGRGFSDREAKALNLALRIMVEEGMLEFDQPDSPAP
jgi:hypothetical protein